MARPLTINSKRGIINYLENTTGEYPFIEECWEIAEEETRVRNEKIAEYNKISPKKKKRVATSKVYFEFMQQPRFAQMGKELLLKKQGQITPSEKLEEFKENMVEEEKPKSLNFEDYIEDLESNQGQFILRLLNMYFVELYDEDSIKFIIN